MNATRTRSSSFPAVTVTARLIASPVCCCTLMPQGKPGLVEIAGGKNVTTYSIAYLADRDAGTGRVEVLGYRLTKGTGEVYDLPEDLSHCECLDSLTRSRPGGCRHAAGLRQLQDAGLIA